MRTLVTIRRPGEPPFPLVIEDDRFGDPDDGPIDGELATGHLYAVPGLADSHAHLGMSSMAEMLDLTDEDLRRNARHNAWLQVESGVLLVADKGSGSDATLEILSAPPTERPEAFMAGRVIAPEDGYYARYGYEVDEDGLVEAVRAVDRRAAWVKIVGDWPRKGSGPRANYSQAALARAVEVAHAAGRKVAVHTMAPAGVRLAVDAGVDSIEHGTFLSSRDLAVLADRGGVWVPTVLNTEFLVEFLGADSSGGRLMLDGLANLKELLPEAERLGVTILAGTDLAVPHGDVAREAVKLHEYGLSTTAALTAVSTAAYDYLGFDRRFAVGSPANAVFFADDPREHVETLGDPQMIIRAGRVIRSSGAQ
ncbi:MAG: amidohydrolase family protein [Acidimicrobiia bacterium]|nr:MAG: amidohydrolase family protein [Acidimicrobiia bacterium]